MSILHNTLSTAQISADDELLSLYLLHFVRWSQQWYGIPVDFAEVFTNELYTYTQGWARFRAHSYNQPPISPYDRDWHSILVTWNATVFGNLEIAVKCLSKHKPIIPLSVAYQIALYCGWLFRIHADSLIATHSNSRDAQERIHSLTTRQKELLVYLIQGLSLEEISERMNIAYSTIERHQSNLYLRLNIHSRREATSLGMAAGMY